MSISGKFLSCSIGATVIAGAHEWSVAEVGDRIEATTGATSGRGKKDVGVIDCRIRIVLYLDVTAGIFTTMRAGTTLSSLKLFAVSTATNPLYTFTTVNVFESTVRGQVRDRFIVELECEPAGNVITAAEPN